MGSRGFIQATNPYRMIVEILHNFIWLGYSVFNINILSIQYI